MAAAIALGLGELVSGCVEDGRDLRGVRKSIKRSPSGLESRSWGLCSLIGPHDHNPGIWGSDLGFTARPRDATALTILFGDTWTAPVHGCQYPGASDNDLQGTLPVQLPERFQPGAPSSGSEQAASCQLLEYSYERPGDVSSWRRIRLFPDASVSRTDTSIDLGGLRTPVSAFSDGEKMFALFARYDPALCATRSDCPAGMQCSSDPSYTGLPVGECGRLVKLTGDPAPDYCRDRDDCVPGTECNPTPGVCLEDAPFDVATPHGRVSPPWYRADPKQGLASIVYVAAAIWPDRPADYAAVARFKTNRFQNVTARTVAYFDPANLESADYGPGYHTLLIWGRQTYVTSAGAQALPFLLYVPLDELRGPPEKVVWKPRFFAGYDADGNPAWSERESDARPIYGGDEQDVHARGNDLHWSEPEFDLVAQMSISWVAPLSRWVMLYGGDLPAFMVLEPRTGKARKPVHLPWAPGAIHMRTAPHPWGAARIAPKRAGAPPLAAKEPGWSSAEPVLTRDAAAPYLGCSSEQPSEVPGCRPNPDESRPLELLGALASAASQRRTSFTDVAMSCVGGELVRAVQDKLSGDMIGRLYAPNIIDEWTQNVTDDAQKARGESSAEVYWNVSTWNPYQVVLVKTQLTVRGTSASQARNDTILVRTD